MADPRKSPVFDVGENGEIKPRGANHSPLMRRLLSVKDGEVVNACREFAAAAGGWTPCDDEDLDHVGGCKHLVGVTNDGKEFEPLVWDAAQGRRVVRPERVPHPNKPGVTVPKLERVKKGDVLLRVTTSSRVYRNVDGEQLAPPPPPADLAERLEALEKQLADALRAKESAEAAVVVEDPKERSAAELRAEAEELLARAAELSELADRQGRGADGVPTEEEIESPELPA